MRIISKSHNQAILPFFFSTTSSWFNVLFKRNDSFVSYKKKTRYQIELNAILFFAFVLRFELSKMDKLFGKKDIKGNPKVENQAAAYWFFISFDCFCFRGSQRTKQSSSWRTTRHRPRQISHRSREKATCNSSHF